MEILYALVGFFLAILGAAPLGASNIAVITTTAKESLAKGMIIAYGAGLGEVLLAFLSLCNSTMLSNFFEMNPWLQALFIGIFFLVGLFFLFPNAIKICLKKTRERKRKNPKLFTGFILAALNPPVLLFWILAISLTSRYLLTISDMSPLLVLTLFFTGVFIGKVATLYFYARWSNKMKKKQQGDKTKLYRLIGIVLILISTVQGIRFLAG